MKQQWDKLRKEFTELPKFPDNVPSLVSKKGYDVVYVPPIGRDMWDKLFKKFPQTRNGLWVSSEFAGLDFKSSEWQVVYIPNSDRPSKVNVTYNDEVDGQKVSEASPTISMYLALQLNRLIRGKDPVDKYTWTWCRDDNYKVKSWARASYWYPRNGHVYVGRVDVGYSDDNLGVRLPVSWKTLESSALASETSSPFTSDLAGLKQSIDRLNDTLNRVFK